MKEQYSISKEKLVSLEEGSIENVEQQSANRGDGSGTCKQLIQCLKLILYVELALFLGWACYSMWQTYHIESMNVQFTDIVREPELQSQFDQRSMQQAKQPPTEQFYESKDEAETKDLGKKENEVIVLGTISSLTRDRFASRISAVDDALIALMQESESSTVEPRKVDVEDLYEKPVEPEIVDAVEDLYEKPVAPKIVDAVEDLYDKPVEPQIEDAVENVYENPVEFHDIVDAVEDAENHPLEQETSNSDFEEPPMKQDFMEWNFPFLWSIHGLKKQEETEVDDYENLEEHQDSEVLETAEETRDFMVSEDFDDTRQTEENFFLIESLRMLPILVEGNPVYAYIKYTKDEKYRCVRFFKNDKPMDDCSPVSNTAEINDNFDLEEPINFEVPEDEALDRFVEANESVETGHFSEVADDAMDNLDYPFNDETEPMFLYLRHWMAFRPESDLFPEAR